MKYPTFNSKELSRENKRLYRFMSKAIRDGIVFDNKQNEMGLSRRDISILTWNAATRALSVCPLDVFVKQEK